MTTEMPAGGGQWRTIAGNPTGFRRLTMAAIATGHVADEFGGLGDNGPGPGQILAAFKAAAPFMGYSARIVHAVDWLFRFTVPQDWREGRRPIVWPSARMQRDELGLSPTRIKALNRALIELGLIAAKDSPNGKRYGHRDRDGHIIEAYGFDLSPMAQRIEEFERVAEEGRAIRARMAYLRRRATIARKGLVQLFAAVAEHGLVDDGWNTLSSEVAILSRALKRVTRLDEMELGVEALERRLIEAQQRFDAQTTTSDSEIHDPKGSDSGPHQYTYKPTPDLKKDSVTSLEPSSNQASSQQTTDNKQKSADLQEPDGRIGQVYPDELLQLAPRLQPYVRTLRPRWSEIVDGAEALRHELEVSRSLWQEACRLLGRETAAIVLAVVSTKDPEHFTRTAAHYFHGMVERAKRGELNLDRTIWGLRALRRNMREA